MQQQWCEHVFSCHHFSSVRLFRESISCFQTLNSHRHILLGDMGCPGEATRAFFAQHPNLETVMVCITETWVTTRRQHKNGSGSSCALQIQEKGYNVILHEMVFSVGFRIRVYRPSEADKGTDNHWMNFTSVVIVSVLNSKLIKI